MAGNDIFDIGGAAVTKFDCITVEYLAVFVVLGEMLLNKG